MCVCAAGNGTQLLSRRIERCGTILAEVPASQIGSSSARLFGGMNSNGQSDTNTHQDDAINKRAVCTDSLKASNIITALFFKCCVLDVLQGQEIASREHLKVQHMPWQEYEMQIYFLRSLCTEGCCKWGRMSSRACERYLSGGALP